ncbi:MAG: tetratricopeptide repeat protein, partial [Candidatus Omnitrophota bacterium]|nr:tetratricopeptide repeat protein [Candidatus Omnitrophota bacterium]
FFSFYLYVIHKHLDKKWIIFALPIVQLLWSNFHGFFFLGILLVLIVLIAEFIKRKIKLPWQWNSVNRLRDIDYNRLKMVLALTILASLANPYTLNGFLYPFRIMFQLAGKSRIFFNYIQELKPAFDWRNFFTKDGSEYYKVIVFISSISFIMNYRKVDIGKLFIWLTFLFSSLVAVRNVAYFSFAAYFVYIFNKDFIFPLRFFSIRYQNKSVEFVNRIIVKGVFMAWAVSSISRVGAGGYYDFGKYEAKSVLGGISTRDYPSQAADFILKNKIKGNVFNDFNSGAYLIGRCFPQVKVYIDGRTEMYGPEFFESYRKVLSEDSKPFEEIAKKYNIKSVFLSGVYHPVTGNLLQYLYKSKSWKLVYFDPVSVIFLKDVPENKSLIEKFNINLAYWKPPEVDLKKLGSSTAYPDPNIRRASVLESLNLDDAVIREAQVALKIMPNCGSAYKFLGNIYKKRHAYEKAFENLRLATVFMGGDVALRVELAKMYLQFNDPDGAIKQLETASSLDPRYATPYYYLSVIYFGNNKINRGREALAKALSLPLPSIKVLINAADSFYDGKAFLEAAQVYQKAVKANKDDALLHARLGACFTYLNKYKEAESELSQAIKLDSKLVSAYNYWGVFYAKQGKGTEAKKKWAQALKLAPQDKETQENINKFMRGEFNK